MDVNVALHGIHLAQPVFSGLEAAEPEDARQYPVSIREGRAQLRRVNLAGRATRNQHRVHRQAAADLGTNVMRATWGFFASGLLAYAIARGRNLGLHEHAALRVLQRQGLLQDTHFNYVLWRGHGSSPDKERHGFHMAGLREHIHHTGRHQTIAEHMHEVFAVAGQGCGITGHIDNA